MLKNPFVNAFLATSYILIVAFGMQSTKGIENFSHPFFLPAIMLSLLVFSVAVMGVLFFYTPAQMFLDNHREAALIFFFKTLGTFAGLTLIFAFLLFF